MSGYHGKRTFSNFHYTHNQLSSDNPFKYFGTNYNPYQPKITNQSPYDNIFSREKKQNKFTPYEESSNLNENKRKANSPYYNKISSNSYAKNSNKNYNLYRQNRDHIGELFNYPNQENKKYYSGNTNNKNDIQSPYSTYTTPQKKNNKYKNYNEINNEKISNIDSTEYYIESPNLIKNYAYKENPNLKYRDYMEDKGISILNINGDPDKALFCLFDGHGGDQVSKFLQNNFIKYFKDTLPFDDVEKCLIYLFKKLDEKIKNLNCFQVGAAACIIYITKENGKRCLYSANVGDTRSILISENNYKRLSYDHRADDSKEYKRIVNEGGIVFAGRVYGSLMLGRAFGDWELKSYGVTCEPYIKRININHDDKYIILATDGVWDTLEDIDVYDLSKKFNNSKELCNTIVYKSLEKGSTDNISCFVINL